MILIRIPDFVRRIIPERWFRVSGASPSTEEECDWCERVRPTTIGEVWCGAYPAGQLVRLCKECREGCAG